jgi:hypothetical protein
MRCLPASFKLKFSRANGNPRHLDGIVIRCAASLFDGLDWLSSCFFQAKIFKSQSANLFK